MSVSVSVSVCFASITVKHPALPLCVVDRRYGDLNAPFTASFATGRGVLKCVLAGVGWWWWAGREGWVGG